MGLTDMPYRDTLGPTAQAWFDRYKERYKVDPNIGAVYGWVAADLTVVGLEKTGPELTVDNFVRGMESIKSYKDIFNGPEASFGPDKHQGANSAFLAVVKGGRWVRLTEPLNFWTAALVTAGEESAESPTPPRPRQSSSRERPKRVAGTTAPSPNRAVSRSTTRASRSRRRAAGSSRSICPVPAGPRRAAESPIRRTGRVTGARSSSASARR